MQGLTREMEAKPVLVRPARERTFPTRNQWYRTACGVLKLISRIIFQMTIGWSHELGGAILAINSESSAGSLAGHVQTSFAQ